MFDEAADPGVLADPDKLDGKVQWLMALFSRAAPTVYAKIQANDLALLPDTDLRVAVDAKFDLEAGAVEETIIEWIRA